MGRKIRIFLLFLAFSAVLIATAFCVQEGSIPQIASTELPLFISTVVPEVKDILGGEQGTPEPGVFPEGDITIQGTPFTTQTLNPTLTPTEVPPRNGQIIFIGLDGGIYALNPDLGSTSALGESADFHVYPGTRWFSQDGAFVLALRAVGENSEIHLVPTSGSGSSVLLGNYTVQTSLSSPQQPVLFSPDDRFVLVTEPGEGTDTIRVVELVSGAKSELSVKSNENNLQIASFLGTSGRIVVVEQDNVSGESYLNVYSIHPNDLVQENRLAVFPQTAVVQFTVSPNGMWIALILEEPAGGQSLYLLDVGNALARELLSVEAQTLLFTEPAWTADGNWFLVNRWFGGSELRYEYLAYNAQSGGVSPIFSGENTMAAGAPVSFITDFAPDNQAVLIAVFDPILDTTANWMVVLGSDYKRKLAESMITNGVSQGELVTDLDRSWLKILIYSSDLGLPTGKLYSAALDGSDRILLDENLPYPYYDIGPVISPDGMKAAYFHIQNPEIESEFGQLSVINLDGSGKKDILQGNPAENMMIGIPLVWFEALP